MPRPQPAPARPRKLSPKLNQPQHHPHSSPNSRPVLLNRENDNLMARFRTAMPDLRPDEYRLFLLNALGFSIPTISLLLKEKREVIYNRRQRLRSKIQESDITDNAPFLDCLE